MPVPDAGVPREVAEAARRAIEFNEKVARAGHREWELSGGIIRCAECGCALVAHTSKWTYHKKDGTPSPYKRYAYRCATYRRTGRTPSKGCSMSKNLHAANTETRVWHSVRDAMLDTEGLERALKLLSRKKTRKTDIRRLAGIDKHLTELRSRRDGYLELAADGLMPRPDLAEKLRPLDAQIAALAAELESLTSEVRRREGVAKGAREILEALKEAGPDALDSLDAAGRRQLYEDIELKVMAHQDGSLTMTWMVDLKLGEFGWQDVRTSTR